MKAEKRYSVSNTNYIDSYRQAFGAEFLTVAVSTKKRVFATKSKNKCTKGVAQKFIVSIIINVASLSRVTR